MKPKKFFNRKSIRLKGYDYSKPGIYYVTICTKNLEFLFGEIVRGVMYPSAGGLFVIQCWNDIPKHYQRVKLYEFTLMPNHIHGILEITDSEENVVEKERNNNVAKVEGFGRAQDIEPLPEKKLSTPALTIFFVSHLTTLSTHLYLIAIRTMIGETV